MASYVRGRGRGQERLKSDDYTRIEDLKKHSVANAFAIISFISRALEPARGTHKYKVNIRLRDGCEGSKELVVILFGNKLADFPPLRPGNLFRAHRMWVGEWEGCPQVVGERFNPASSRTHFLFLALSRLSSPLPFRAVLLFPRASIVLSFLTFRSMASH